jgi:hypothetical protein
VSRAIKQLVFTGFRLVTSVDLILVNEVERMITVMAVKVENGLKLSIVKVQFVDGHLKFRDVILDEHGTIEAAISVLRRSFRWEKIGQMARFGTPLLRLKVKRIEDLDLFIIANWERWNESGVAWKERHYLAQSGEFSIGKMEPKAFVQRCTRMGLRYIV